MLIQRFSEGQSRSAPINWCFDRCNFVLCLHIGTTYLYFRFRRKFLRQRLGASSSLLYWKAGSRGYHSGIHALIPRWFDRAPKIPREEVWEVASQ